MLYNDVGFQPEHRKGPPGRQRLFTGLNEGGGRPSRLKNRFGPVRSELLLRQFYDAALSQMFPGRWKTNGFAPFSRHIGSDDTYYQGPGPRVGAIWSIFQLSRESEVKIKNRTED